MTSPEPPSSVRPVEYKGEPLDAERGPGLGCFRFQLILLAVVIVLTPLSVVWGWPTVVSAGLLFLTIFLLLFAGQTVIFLLRLVAADRREGRRVPLASATPTVGELEDQATGGDAVADETAAAEGEAAAAASPDAPADDAPADETPATPDAPDDDQAASPGVRE